MKDNHLFIILIFLSFQRFSWFLRVRKYHYGENAKIHLKVNIDEFHLIPLLGVGNNRESM